MMKTKIILVLFILIFNSCTDYVEGNGEIITQELFIENFKGFNITESIDIRVIESDEQKVYVTGDSNIISIISKNVSNEIWDIDFTENNLKDFVDLKIEIHSPDLNSIEINGSSLVDIESINSVSGNLSINIPGSGKIRSVGIDTLEDLSIQVDGSASTELFDLNVNNCKIDVSGSGSHRVFVNNNLDVTISGSSDVYYKGKPNINSSTSGSGTIINDN